jgi:hypothetical protein
MPDKRPTDHPADDQIPAPKRPPKAPAQDYSSIPQKPIKLKAGVDLPPVLKRSGAKAPSAKKEASPPIAKKKKPRKPRTKPSPPETEAFSEQTWALASSAAKDAGLCVTEWIEKTIIEKTQSPAPASASDLEAIHQALQQISERLGQLENRKGFWRRFWEQYVEPYQK